MFSKISLKAKLILVAMFPFVAYLIMAGFKIQENRENLAKADKTLNNVTLIKALSGLIHEFQKERAKSIAYLGGAITISDLDAQRSLTDSQNEALSKNKTYATAEFEAGFKALDEFSTIRTKITSKQIDKKDAIQYFSSTVASLINGYASLSATSLVIGIPMAVRSSAILETTKESAGRLRANTIAAITENAPLNPTQYKTLNSLKEGIDLGLSSHGLAVSPEGKLKIQNFKTSSHWTESIKVVEFILKNSEIGKYNQDQKSFYDNITASIDDLAVIINQEVKAVEDKTLKAQSDAKNQLWFMSTMVGLFALFLVGFLIYVIRGISNAMTKSINDLTTSSTSVTTASFQLSEASQELSSATTESAASLQETSSSLNEVLAMTDRNSVNSKRSQELSSDSTNSVKEGKVVVDDMIKAINEISHSTKGISDAVETSNREISEIVKVIGDIGEKTKVINDIVFQTKLLSFNASVEAARAGEHGKGFAVVAEEVGNLAQMSGNAAKEITSMLDGSIQRVKNIVEQTKRRVEGLVVESRQKVDAGTTTAEKCRGSLDKILKSVEQVDAMIGEIFEASKEQSTGIGEINKAMQQLDDMTQQNNSVAHQCANSSQELTHQSDQLKGIVDSLNQMLNGGHSLPSKTTQYYQKETSVKKVSPFKKTETKTPYPSPKHYSEKKVAGDSVTIPAESDSNYQDV